MNEWDIYSNVTCIGSDFSMACIIAWMESTGSGFLSMGPCLLLSFRHHACHAFMVMDMSVSLSEQHAQRKQAHITRVRPTSWNGRHDYFQTLKLHWWKNCMQSKFSCFPLKFYRKLSPPITSKGETITALTLGRISARIRGDWLWKSSRNGRRINDSSLDRLYLHWSASVK